MDHYRIDDNQSDVTAIPLQNDYVHTPPITKLQHQAIYAMQVKNRRLAEDFRQARVDRAEMFSPLLAQ